MNLRNFLKKKWDKMKPKSKLLDKASEVKEIVEEKIVVKKEEVKEEKKVIDGSLNLTAYDIIKDEELGGNRYLAVTIKYNLATKKTSITYKPYYDKTSGMSMFMDKENRKYLFEKNNGGGRK